MYLEDKYSDDTNRLLPTGVAERAQVYQRMFESFNVHNIILENLAYYLLEAKKEDWKAEYVKGCVLYISIPLVLTSICL